MERNQMKVQWQGEVVSVQPRSAVWRYLIDNRTHREYGYNVFLKGEVRFNDETVHLDNKFDKYDYCVAVSEKQAVKAGISIGDIIKGTGWTKKYPEIEFADFYRAGSLKKLKAAETSHSSAMSIEIDTVNTRYDGTPIPRVNSADYPGPPWKQAVRITKMGPARAVPYKGMSGVKDQGWLDEICVEYRRDEDE